MKNGFRWIKTAALAAVVSVPAWADDTDIYTSTGAVTGGIVRVMVTLDLGANSTKTYCSDASSLTCADEDHMGDQLYQYMDLFNAWGEEMADGLLDWDQPYDPNDQWHITGVPWEPGMDIGSFQTVAEAKWGTPVVQVVGLPLDPWHDCLANPVRFYVRVPKRYSPPTSVPSIPPSSIVTSSTTPPTRIR